MTDSNDIVITVERREELGKGAAGRLRREGIVPAVVYGGGKAPVSIQVNEKVVKDLLKQEAGENTIFLLKLKGTKEERRAMIKEIQADPLTGAFEHIDFIRVMRGHKLTVDMPIELEGTSPGVKAGGRMDFITRQVQIEILPREMFDKLTVDLSELEIGARITVADLMDQMPKSAKVLGDEGRVVLQIEAARAVEEDTDEDEAERLISDTAEPELIKKGKDEDGAE